MKLYGVIYVTDPEQDEDDARFETREDGSLYLTPDAARAWDIANRFNEYMEFATDPETALVYSTELKTEVVV